MLERNAGRIILLASEAAVMPSPEMAHYSATKAAILSLSRSLAETTKGTRVTVNAILAGSTKTEGVRDFVSGLYPDMTFEEAEAEFMGPRGNRNTSLIQRLIEQQHAARGATARYPARQMAEISLAVFEGLSIHRLLDPDSVTDETLDITLSAFFDLMGVPPDSDEIPNAPARVTARQAAWQSNPAGPSHRRA